MKLPISYNISFWCGLVVIISFVCIQVNGYPMDIFTQDEIEDFELEQQLNDDLDTLGYDREFLWTLAKNLKRAIKEANSTRQLFQGGNFGGGLNGGGGYQNPNAGQQGAEDEEEDDDSTATTIAGPGALGILSGLFGIFSGIGTLNPDRILASTVNFFPPRDREQAQSLINQALLKPSPPAPPTRPPAMRRTTPGVEGKNSTGDPVSDVTGIQIADLGSGNAAKPKPVGSYTVRPRKPTTPAPDATTPFQDDEFDHEQQASKFKVRQGHQVEEM